MIIENAGKVTDRISLLGKKESNVYLLMGEGEYAVIGGGMIHIAPDVVKQLENFAIDEKKITRIIILHAHFDHCGLIPFFKKRWPWAKVTASSRAKELLSTPKVSESIKAMNQGVLAMYGQEKNAAEMGFEFTGIEVEEPISDGDILHCGNLTMDIIDVPGHSSCSIAVYVPEEKAMFASDAGGIPSGNHIFAAANSDFDKFQTSLEKMDAYDIEVHLAEHGGAFTGKDGRDFLKRSIEAAGKTRQMIENSLKRTMDEKKTTQEITDVFLAGGSGQFLPKDVLSIVVGQMTRFIARNLT
ncbi:MAG: MBL fold metallo-hydrolase [Deltaproteobacteria bacterium]|nr:MBL fold metallo-hydrolase [Deltaproteobacteria bacterium]MBW2181851.1 MBL fold metallo-hydrolase [Deltaproteobacteria bacterium]